MYNCISGGLSYCSSHKKIQGTLVLLSNLFSQEHYKDAERISVQQAATAGKRAKMLAVFEKEREVQRGLAKQRDYDAAERVSQN